MPTQAHGRYTSRIPEISRKLPKELYDVAMPEAAEAIKEIAKQLCPVGSGHVHLRDRIHVERMREGDRHLTWVVAGDKEAWYGHLVEWGHVQKGGHGDNRDVRFVPPHPFMVPAAEAGREIARKRADQAIKNAAQAQ